MCLPGIFSTPDINIPEAPEPPAPVAPLEPIKELNTTDIGAFRRKAKGKQQFRTNITSSLPTIGGSYNGGGTIGLPTIQ